MNILNYGDIIIIDDDLKVMIADDVKKDDTMAYGLTEFGKEVTLHLDKIDYSVTGEKELHMTLDEGAVINTCDGHTAWIQPDNNKYILLDTGRTGPVLDIELDNSTHGNEFVLKPVQSRFYEAERVNMKATPFRQKFQLYVTEDGEACSAEGIATSDIPRLFDAMPILKSIRTRTISANIPVLYIKEGSSILAISNNGEKSVLIDNGNKTKSYYKCLAEDISNGCKYKPLYEKLRELMHERTGVLRKMGDLDRIIECGECHPDKEPASPEIIEEYCQLRLRHEELTKEIREIMHELNLC